MRVFRPISTSRKTLFAGQTDQPWTDTARVARLAGAHAPNPLIHRRDGRDLPAHLRRRLGGTTGLVCTCQTSTFATSWRSDRLSGVCGVGLPLAVFWGIEVYFN